MKKTPTIVIIAALCFCGFVHAESGTYVIKKGDTLYGLSRKYNITIDSLKKYNEITDPSKIYPGMILAIPGGYTVVKGDTFYGIARKYGIAANDLVEQNDMELTDVLYPGQILSVPGLELADNDGSSGNEDEDDPNNGTNDKSGDADETEIIAAVTVDDEDTGDVSYSDFYWPHYGTRSELTGKLRGIQIDGNPGDEVFSVSGGTVVWASQYGIYKNLVLVEGGNGIVYGYGGNEESSVNVGDSVRAGSVIGVLGGNEAKTDAYFFVYKNGKPLDPEKAPRV